MSQENSYAQGRTHQFFQKIRDASQPLPADVVAGDNLVTLSLERKQAMRPKLWPIIHRAWEIAGNWRQTERSTAGVRLKAERAPQLEELASILGRGCFLFCLRLGDLMSATLVSAFASMRADPEWQTKIAEVDRLIDEMMWEIMIAHLRQAKRFDDASRAAAYRRQGKTASEVFQRNYSLEGMVVDEIQTAFQIISGLIFVGAVREPRASVPETVLLVTNSVPLIVDWANQSVGGFDGIRAAQQFYSDRTQAAYGSRGLNRPECYTVAGTDVGTPHYAFTDAFIDAHQEPLCDHVRRLSPHRITCGGIRPDIRGVSPVVDSVHWMLEILQSQSTLYEQLVVDF